MGSIAVIGGGAAGLMAAIAAAKERAGDVFILERNEKVAKKLLATGNGKCNFTNLYQSPGCYFSEEPLFAWPIIKRFDEREVLDFFYGLGVCSKNRNGYVYPLCDQASAVAEALEDEAKRLKVKILTGRKVKKITGGKKGFVVRTDEDAFFADRVILAAGSKAAPKTGSDGSGYDLAKALGHKIIPVLPALTQLRCRGDFFKYLNGVRVYGKIMIFIEGEYIVGHRGEIQLTARGISGIPAFQVSRHASKALYEKKNVKVVLNFMPDFQEGQLSEFLKDRKNTRPKKHMGRFLNGLFPSKLSFVIIKIAGIDPDKEAGKCSNEEMERLKSLISNFTVEVTGVSSFEYAQVCRGGVDTDGIDIKTMQSALVPGLYFAGEILDVDAICGGYNLQWAWSSGHIAGKSAAESLKGADAKGKAGFTKN